MKFSELYAVSPGSEDDWFDTFLPADTNLAVDPFLIYEDEDARWKRAHNRILEFFAVVFDLIGQSKGNKNSMAWKKAQSFLLFPEPAEFCLGVAEGTPLGIGAGKELQEGMLDGIRTAVGLGIDNIEHMEMLTLFQGGMGFDRISDAVCNILKSDFIEYTQGVCKRHGIATERFPVRNATWSEAYARWQPGTVQLPLNPFTKRAQPTILVPERFLRDIPVATADDFWTFAWKSHADELRNDFNYDIARSVGRSVKARMARQRPSVVKEYLKKLEQEKHKPYPVTQDPKLLVNWYEAGAGIVERTDASFVPNQLAEFKQLVDTIIAAYRHNIEAQDGWYLLWTSTAPRPERAAQALFRSVALHYCRANEIDISGEANAGRGPVDFKFSQGWTARTVVEVKLVKNSKFWDGILAQTPTYAMAEEANSAHFVAIAYTDKDMESDRVQRVHEAASVVSDLNGVSVAAVIVDARRKLSASKLTATAEAKKALKERDRPETDNGD